MIGGLTVSAPALMGETDFDEEGEAAFPVGGGAGDVRALAASSAFEEAEQRGENKSFGWRQLVPGGFDGFHTVRSVVKTVNELMSQ